MNRFRAVFQGIFDFRERNWLAGVLFALSLAGSAQAAITITPTTLPNGLVGTAYSQTMVASGGTAPYTWSIQSGALPPGMSLNTSSGAITGTPTTAGVSTVTFHAIDAPGVPGNSSPITITVQQTTTISAAPLPAGASQLGSGVTLTATVSPGTATGKVAFYHDGTIVATGTIASGNVTVFGTLLPVGLNYLTAHYLGDSLNLGSTSPQFTKSILSKPQAGFTSATAYPTGAAPWIVAAADLNGDARPDVITGNFNDGTVSVRLANSNGTLAAATTVAVAGSPTNIVLGDFNGDGKADIAASCYYCTTPTISILLGNGDGTFAARVDYTAGIATNPGGLAATDINGDGKIDLVVSNNGSSSISVLLGDGTGAFGTGTAYSVGLHPGGIVAGDFNGDGRIDVAVESYDGGNVAVLLGQSGGVLGSAINYTAGGTGTYSIALGDFNGDGKLDLAMPNIGSNNVGVLLGTGSGTFTVASGSPFAVGAGPSFVAVGDFNGDHLLDIVASNDTSNNLSVLLGNGAGGFAAAVTYATGSRGIAVADFNTDGVTDIVTTNYSANTVTVLLGIAVSSTTLTSSVNPTTLNQSTTLTATVQGSAVTGTVTFTDGPATIGSPVTLSSGVATLSLSTLTAGSHTLVATYSGDTLDTSSTSSALNQTVNLPVSVTTTSLPSATISAAYSQTLSATGGTGSYTWTVNSGTFPAGLSLNGATGVISGTPSVAGSNTLTFKATDTASNFAVSSTISLAVVQASTLSLTVSPGGVTAFGSSVTLTATLTPSAGTGKVTFFDGATPVGVVTLSSGIATFPTRLLSSGSRKLKAFYQGDSSYAGSVSNSVSKTIQPGLQSGFVLPPAGYGTSNPIQGYNPRRIALADFNGDGKTDVVAVNTSGPISVYLGAGDGTLGNATIYQVGGIGRGVAVGDFDGDGHADFAVTCFSCSPVSVGVFLGNGSGGFATRVDYTSNLGTGPAEIATGDFNGDGKTDLAITSGDGSSTVTVLLGNGAGAFGSGTQYTASSPSGLVVADFNGDGRADIATSSANNSTISVLLGQAGGGFVSQALYSPGGTGASSIAAADFNGDGNLDLVVANNSSGTSTVGVLAGTGSGTFGAATTYAVGTSPHGVKTGDFNGDGFADIATANYDSNDVSILLGNGSGGFSSATAYAGSPIGTFEDIAVGDFNGDSVSDIAAASFNSYKVGIYQGLVGTTTTLTSSVNPVQYGQSTTLTATVAPSTATGTVTFRDGATTVGGPQTIFSGAASLPISSLSGGSHSLTAVYSGDANNSASTSSVVTQTVQLPTITITTASPLPAGGQSSTYSKTFAATGATGQLTWTVSAGSLPSGLTLSGLGVISGTPTAAGTSTFTILATDPSTATNSKAFSLTIYPSLTITTSSLSAATAAIAYSQTFAASGGSGSYTWQAADGPTEITMSSAGVFSGIPAIVGTFSPIQVVVTDTQSGIQTFQNFSLTVQPGTLSAYTTNPNWTSASSGSLTSATITGTPGGHTSYGGNTSTISSVVFSAPNNLTNCGLPFPNCTSNAANGWIEGYVRLIATPPTSVNVTSFGGTYGAYYGNVPQTVILTATTAAGATLTATINPGVSTAFLGFVSTTPNDPIISVVANAGHASNTPAIFDFAYYSTAYSPLSITTSSFPSGVVNAAYATSVSGTGGSGNYSWTAAGLPAGLTMSASGLVTGTPTAAGSFNPSVVITDTRAGSSTSVYVPLTINPALTVTTSSLATGALSESYSQTLAASGGYGENSWVISAGTLPAGLTFNGLTGTISGTPTTTGTTNLIFQVNDGHSTVSSGSLTLTINTQLTITNVTLPSATQNVAYSQTLAATGGTGGNVWSLASGSLPGDITLNAAGVLSGTTTATGTFTFTARVTDTGSGSTTLSLTLVAVAPVTITTTSLSPGTQASAYSLTLAATGGTSPYTWSVTSGALPSGVTLSTGGLLSGTPTAAGTFSFTAQAMDTQSHSGSQALSLLVNPIGSVFNGRPVQLTWAYPDTSSVYQGPATATVGAGVEFPAFFGSNTAFNVDFSDKTIQIDSNTNGCCFSSAAFNGLIITNPGTLPAFTSVTLTASNWFTTGSVAFDSSRITFDANHIYLDFQNMDNQVGYGITLKVNGVSLQTSSLPSSAVGFPYSAQLTVAGGTGISRTFSLASGTLPPGLSLNSTSGLISGVPTTAGTYAPVIQLSDSGGSTTRTYTVVIRANGLLSTRWQGTPLAAYSGPAAIGTAGDFWNSYSTATGSGTLSDNANQATPVGVSWTSDTAWFSNNSNGFCTPSPTPYCALMNGYLAKNNGQTANITYAGLPANSSWDLYLYQQIDSGGSRRITITANGTTASTTADNSGTDSTFILNRNYLITTVTADGSGNLSISYHGIGGDPEADINGIQLRPHLTPLTITQTTIPAGVAGTPYSTGLLSSGGTASGLIWSTASSLPSGITFSPSGVLSGNTSLSGSFPFTAVVTDSQNNQATQNYSLVIYTPVTVSTTTLPAGSVGTAYNQTLAATGGTGSYTWTITNGALISGLNLNPSTGAITGTPTATGSNSVTFRATDTGSNFATQTITVAVVVPVTVSTSSLPVGSVNAAYSKTLTATGGTGSYTWTIASGSLPSGLSLNAATGVISGTPAASSSSNLVFTATDTGSHTGSSSSLALQINTALTINVTSFPTGVVGTAYTSTLTRTGGVGPFTWSVLSGNLPDGLSLNSSTGTVTGTPTTPGVAVFTIQLTDSAAGLANYGFAIGINPPLSFINEVISDGTAKIPYRELLYGNGGTGSGYTFGITSGALPAGISMNSQGVFSGTPTVTGAYSFTVTVTDSSSATASHAYSLNLEGYGVVNVQFQPIDSNLYSGPGVIGSSGDIWNRFHGATGSGTSLLDDIANTTGISTTYSATATNENSGSGFCTLETRYCGLMRYYLSAAPGNTGAITFGGFTPGSVWDLYFYTQTSNSGRTLSVTINGGTAVASSASNGADGAFALGRNYILITGTADVSGNLNISFGSTNGLESDINGIQMTPHVAPLTISTTSLPSGVPTVGYSQTLVATGGTGLDQEWSVIGGCLPAGLSLNPETGVISGTPTDSGTSTFTIFLSDGLNYTATTTLSIVVAPPISISTISLPNGVVSAPYSQPLVATGGAGGNVWTLSSGSLPSGLTLSTAGVISGTPTVTGTASFTVRVTDAGSTFATQALTLQINPAVTVTTSALSSGEVTLAYSQNLSASGGLVGGYTWTITSGTLQSGLSLNASTGQITGTPTASGTANLIFKANDTGGNFATSASLALTVNPAVSVLTTALPTAVVTAAYNQNLSPTGGLGPYTWSVAAGPLPGGLSLSSSGVISGTPTAAGSFPVTFRVTDSLSAQATRAITIQVNGPVTITTTARPGGTVGFSYSSQLSATGGVVAGYTYSLISGALPTGLTLSTSGLISGAPSASGTFSPIIQATDSSNTTSTNTFTISIRDFGTLNTRWQNSPTSGYTGPGAIGVAGDSWNTLTSANGFSYLNDSAGQATPATATWTSDLAFYSSNLNGFCTQSTSFCPLMNGYLAKINGATGNVAFSGLPPNTSWDMYLYQELDLGTGRRIAVTVNGSTTATTTVDNDSTDSTFILNKNYLVVTANTDGSGIFSVDYHGLGTDPEANINGIQLRPHQAPLIITQTTAPSGVQNAAYLLALSATGGTGAGQIWSLNSGTLPSGITLSGSGTISGAPTANGSFNITVLVVDSGGNRATQAYTLLVNPPVQITTSTLPAAVQGSGYSQTLSATGGLGGYTWTITSGLLQSGLSLNAGTGVISGTPTGPGSSTVTFLATDTGSNSGSRAITLQVNLPVSVLTSTLATGAVNETYSQTLVATGGLGSYVWTISGGTLPSGLQLNSGTGVISGSPAASGNTTLIFLATDSGGHAGTSSSLTLTVNAALTISTASFPAGVTGSGYSQTLASTGGAGTITFAIQSGTLPTGLSLTGSTGSISGTTTTAGTYSFVAAATDAGTTVTKSLSITVNPPVTVTTITLPGAVQGSAYSQTLVGSGGVGSPYTWTLTGSLPAGLSLNATTGVISGTSIGSTTSFTFTVQVHDASGNSGSQSLTITVNPPVSVLTTSLLPGAIGQPFTRPLDAAGGLGGYTWTITSGTLQAGLSLNAATGLISGTPTVSGTVTVTFRATDSGGYFGTSSPVSLTIAGFTSTTLTSSLASPSLFGAALTLSATVTPGTPAGKVTFYDGPTVLGVGTLTGGVATLSTRLSGTGTRKFTAYYQGDHTSNLPSTSAALSQTINSLSQNSFATPVTYATGAGPWGSAGADFNGDGKTDLVVANYGASTLSLFLGTGAGSLGTATTIQVSTNPIAVTVGDFNGDGKSDIAAANLLANSISILLGNGDGTFAAAVNYTYGVGTHPDAIIAADLDADGFVDLALVNYESNDISVQFGAGDGTFTSGGKYLVGSHPTGIAAGDFNNDGRIDLAVSNQGSNTVSILLGQPGSFASAANYSAGGSAPQAIVAYDFDGDGNLDLAITDNATNAVNILPGNGTGGFATVSARASGTAPYFAAVGDFNGDGKADLAVANDSNSNASILSGDGLGGFGAAVATAASGSGARGITVGDFNGDGVTDLAISNYSFNAVSVYLGLATTTTSLTSSLNPTNFGQPTTLTATVAPSSATGTVTFLDGSTTLGTGTVAGGLATLNISTLTAGPHSLTAAYGANGNTAGSTSAAITQTVYPPVVISTTTLPAGVQGSPYGQGLAATGGVGNYGWTILSGALPAGLNLNASTGAIAGTPTATGSGSVVFLATDGNGATAAQAITFTILAPVSVTTSSLSTGAVGENYNQTLTATGGLGSYTWSITAGSLQTGLSLNSSTGVISGSPTASGTATLTLLATDGGSHSGVSGSLALIVNPALTLVTTTLGPAVQGTPYSQTLTASGGLGTYTWALTSGALPTGLSLNGTTGVISGTPTVPGNPGMTLRVSDTGGATAIATFTLLANPPVSILTSALPAGVQGVAYNQGLVASGGLSTAGYSWSVTAGALPGGLTLNPTSAPGNNTTSLSGTPTATGTFNFTITTTDSGSNAGSHAYSVIINPPVSVTTTSLPTSAVSEAYSKTLTAAGGLGGNIWTITAGTLPNGLNLNASTGLISGTPTASGTANLTFQVADSGGNTASSASLALVTNSALVITTSSLPGAVQTVGYSQPLLATGGVGSYTWSIQDGLLPSGLTLSAAGVISGTPTNTGSYTVGIQVADAGRQVTKALTIVVNGTLSITTTSLTGGTTAIPYQQQITVSGGSGTGRAFSVTSGALPAGLTLDGSSGFITGTPTGSGSFPLTIHLADSSSLTAAQAYTIEVSQFGLISLRFEGASPSTQTGPAVIGQTNDVWNAFTTSSGTRNNLVDGASNPTGISVVYNATGTIVSDAAGTGFCSPTVTDYCGLMQSYIASSAAGGLTFSGFAPGSVWDFFLYTQPNTSGRTLSTFINAGIPAVTSPSSNLDSTFILNKNYVVAQGVADSDGNMAVGFASANNQEADLNGLQLRPHLAALTITQTTAPAGVQNAQYALALSAMGGTGTGFAWTISGGALPSGLALDVVTGLISGAPATSGSFTFTVQVKDSQNNAGTQTFTANINAAVTITTSSLTPGVAGAIFNQTLTGFGGLGNLTWTIISGTLPNGLSLIAETGQIYGTPTTAGSATITYKAVDGAGNFGTRAIPVTINAPVSIITSSLPPAVSGATYTQSLSASGGLGSYTWNIASGALPSGLVLNGSTGVVSGTPTVSGPFTVAFRATDSNGNIGTSSPIILTVQPPVSISTSTLPEGVQNSAYSQSLAAAGGLGGYTWSLLSGPLPNGITLNASGLLAGTPTVSGGFPITVRVADSAGNFATQTYTLTINIPLNITQTSLPAGAVSQPYSSTLSYQGGLGGNVWTITAGTLQAGLTLSSGGVIAGTPTASGTANLTFKVTDSGGNIATKTIALDINSALTITTTSLPVATRNRPYSQSVAVTGGLGTRNFSISTGTLPAGLSLDAATGLISGTPTTVSNIAFYLTVTDQGTGSATQQLSIRVLASVTVTTTTVPNGVQGVPYTTTLAAAGGQGPYTWSVVSGTAPDGIELDPATGVVSGTPTTAGSPFTISVRALDSIGNFGTVNLTAQVFPPASITTSSLPNGVQGASYNQSFVAAGGFGQYTFSVSAGQLPAELALSSGGVLTGTPTAAGTYNFTIKVVDSSTSQATQTYTLVVNPPVTITTTTLPNATQGTGYTQTLTAAGGIGALTWSFASGTTASQAGLTINPATGELSGTPNTFGTLVVNVKTQDTVGNNHTRSLNLLIARQGGSSYDFTVSNSSSGKLVRLGSDGANPLTICATPCHSGNIASDAQGNIYSHDTSGIYKITPGGVVTTVLTRQGGAGGVAVDGSGNVIFVDNSSDAVYRVAAGVATQVALFPQLSPNELEDAYVAIDGSGNYVVASDEGGSVNVYRFTPAGAATTLATFPGDGVSGLAVTRSGIIQYVDYKHNELVSYDPSGAPNNSTSITLPGSDQTLYLGLTIDPANGDAIIPERSAATVSRITAAGAVTTIFTGTPLSGPLSIAVVPTLVAPSISTNSLPGAIVGQGYGPFNLQATGGSGNFSWSASGLAPGFTLSESGAFSGGPTAPGSFNIVVTATDVFTGLSATKTLSLTITSNISPISISSSSSQASVAVGGAISASFGAIGGTPPYTFSVSGLPGLSINSSGALSGTGSAPGTFSGTVFVSDTGGRSASTGYTFTVLGLSISSFPTGLTGTPYSAAVSALGGLSPFSFTAAGLPPGLSIGATGAIAGTPTASGTFSVTIVVMDGGGARISASVSISVLSPGAPVSIPSGALPDATVNVLYSASLSAISGKAPYTWSVISGAVPDGMSFGSNGTLSGNPTTPGGYSFGVVATDASGGTASTAASVNVKPAALLITSKSPLASGMNGFEYPPVQLAASGGLAPYKWSLSSGAVPAGMTFDAGGNIGGQPAEAGSFSLGATVTDAAGTVTTSSFAFVIRQVSADLILSSGTASFALTTGADSVPSGQSVNVQSTVVATQISYGVQVSPAVPWLTVTNGTRTPDSINIALSSAALSLPAGDYAASVIATCGTGSCAGSAQSIAVSLSVTSPPSRLKVGTDLLSFVTTAQSLSPISQDISLQNVGGGSLGIASVSCGAPWCSVGGPPAIIAGGGSKTVSITVNPAAAPAGFQRTTVEVNSSGGKGSVPVTLFVAQSSAMTLSPSGSQFTMQKGGAPGNGSGSFLVSVNSTSTINFTAAQLPGADWLKISTTSFGASSNSPGTVSYSIDPTVASTLATGAYYGQISVGGAGVINAPQSHQVILNVTPATDAARPDPQPAGLLFLSTIGGGNPPQQTVTLYTTSAKATPFQASATSDGGWLSVTPGLGATSQPAPASTNAVVNVAGLQPGVYNGLITYAFGTAGVRSVNVTLVVSPATGTAATLTSGSTLLPRDVCAPAVMAPVQTGIVSNFSSPAAWPTPLSVKLVDNCGGTVTGAQVVTTFSNGDPPLALALVDPKNGLYAGTWTPRKTSSTITINARFTAKGYKDLTTQLVGTITPNAAPLVTSHGTVHAFSPLVGAPLAPGNIVAVYGSNLAILTGVPATVPLPTIVNGTQVYIGGIKAPLYYTSPTQVNAQIPYELDPNKQYQVVVSANGALSTPDDIQLSAVVPGLAAYADGTVIAQHADGTLVDSKSPAKGGDIAVAYLSGLGITDNDPASGGASPGDVLAHPTVLPTLTIGGKEATIKFVGLTPGLVGLYQMNFEVPTGLNAGNPTMIVTQSGTASNTVLLPYVP